MEHRVTALETRLDTILPTLATKADIAEVRSDLQRTTTETTRWMIATVIGLFLGFTGLYFATSKTAAPPPPVTQPAPIIIQVPYPAQSPSAQPAAAPNPKK